MRDLVTSPASSETRFTEKFTEEKSICEPETMICSRALVSGARAVLAVS